MTLVMFVLAVISVIKYFAFLMTAVLLWVGPRYTEDLLLRRSSKYQILDRSSIQVLPSIHSFIVPMSIVLRTGIILLWGALLGLAWALT